MNFPEPSKEVKDLKTLHQDLYEVKRIQASLDQLPSGNLRTSLAERVDLYLSTGKSIKSLEKELSDSRSEVKSLETRIALLTRESEERCRELVPEIRVGFGWGALIIAFFIGHVVATLFSLR